MRCVSLVFMESLSFFQDSYDPWMKKQAESTSLIHGIRAGIISKTFDYFAIIENTKLPTTTDGDDYYEIKFQVSGNWKAFDQKSFQTEAMVALGNYYF